MTDSEGVALVLGNQKMDIQENERGLAKLSKWKERPFLKSTL